MIPLSGYFNWFGRSIALPLSSMFLKKPQYIQRQEMRGRISSARCCIHSVLEHKEKRELNDDDQKKRSCVLLLQNGRRRLCLFCDRFSIRCASLRIFLPNGIPNLCYYNYYQEHPSFVLYVLQLFL